MVGCDTVDDAGVYQLRDDLLLIQTVDFFTPIVDDPYTYGAIAAANALSDVYAMGGHPLLAMNIVCYAMRELGPGPLQAILQGGYDKVVEAGASIVGGHSIEDREPKYGLAVTGLATPGELTTNAGAKPGDVLVLTKPIGTGVMTTALKRQEAREQDIAPAINSMMALNSPAAGARQRFDAHACTDITGFGFLGHAFEMARASGVELQISAGQVPLLDGASECVAQKLIPGGLLRNKHYLRDRVVVDAGMREEIISLLYDPQTSGGLLISLPPARADQLVATLQTDGFPHCLAAVVGRVQAGVPGRIIVQP